MYASVTNMDFTSTYVNYCNFRHEEESCSEKSYHIQTCAKRHPIDKCKFYRVYISAANLVLFVCLYSHIPASYVNATQVQMDDFEDRNKTIEAQIENCELFTKDVKLNKSNFKLLEIEKQLNENCDSVLLMQNKIEDFEKNFIEGTGKNGGPFNCYVQL